MKTDPAMRETDELFKQMERKIAREYRQASKEAEEKLYKYLERFQEKDAEKRLQMHAGLITNEEYIQWRKGQIMIGKRWTEMKNTLAEDYHNANNIAKSVVNGYMPEVYALNHNYGTFEVESQSQLDTSYTLYDRQSVERLMRNDPDMLPPPGKKVSEAIAAGRDIRWNKQQIQSVMIQSILQGETIPQIADRLSKKVGDSNKASAIRNARTMTTGAENAGKVDSYKRAQSMGIEMRQMWLAALDMRTRDSHRQLDGEVIDVGGTFSNGLKFPGDPNGRPEEVYNCRCRVVGQLKGFEIDPSDLSLRRNEKLGDMTYEEWKNEHKTQNTPEHEIVNGQDISNTWRRRSDEFDFAIEDVINAQGFDGLPRVVTPEEFNKYVEDSNFIAQRTYSAPDQNTLEMYREQLYHGKWYVDCSNGGAAHGQGMYCVGEQSKVVTEYMNNAMTSYGGRNQFAYIETFTLDKSAKIISEENIKGFYTEIGSNIVYGNLSKYGYNKEETDFIAALRGIGGQDIPNIVNNFMSDPNTSDRAIEIMQEIGTNKSISDDIIKSMDTFLSITKDNGITASIMGYDAIYCGDSQKYYVILNRTKVIFKRG